ncbi:hypothetical protein F5Y16DRAFT_407401 [Xylariaceae sp. FL0255]|nr:hypothetical protein F5Y16DRAFT_407401 [Xylariaceae sp. FL0255]
MPAPKPELRVRRYHSRSRNGCTTCKTKHIRCDERKPLCTNCLVKGGECGYTTDTTTKPTKTPSRCDTETPPPCDDAVWHAGTSMLRTTAPNHMFVGFPVEMRDESRFLFDIFTQYRSVVHKDSLLSPESFIIRRALSSPACLHVALLMTAIKFTWDTGSMDRIKKSFLHHKLEAIKFVNDQLQNPMTASSDCTIASIAALALAESALGCRDTAKAHVTGLSQILEMRDDEMITDGNIFQSLVILTSRGTGKLTLRELLDATRGIQNEECLGMSTFRMIPDRIRVLLDREADFSGKTVGEALEEATESGYTQGIKPTTVPTNAVSRARLMSCYLCVFAMLGTNVVDPFMLNWLVEWMLSDLTREEEAMRQGRFPRQIWFWGILMVTCAVVTARPSTDLEVYQIEEWKELCHQKIRLVSRALNLTTWEQTKRIFMSWVWRDNYDEEQQVREMWEEAMYGKRLAMIRTASPSCFERHDFMSAKERAKSIVRAQIVHMRRLMLT